MDISVKKDPFLNFFFICLGFILTVLLACLFLLWRIDAKEIESSEKAYRSLVIANEMRRSSDELTKMVRLYVLTGEIRYVDHYKEILAIRNGTSARPDKYSEVYWDFVLEGGERPRESGEAISLVQSMKMEGFSKKELGLIEESQRLSDKLSSLEVEAINLMQGRYNNGSGDYSVMGAPNPALARTLVSNSAYMKEKAKIMKPLYLFSLEVRERTLKLVDQLRKDSVHLIVIALVLSILATISMVICLFKALKALKSASKTNERLLLNMFPQAIVDRLKEGEETISNEYQGTVLFVHIRHFSDNFSLDVLSQLFDTFQALAEQFGIEKMKFMGDNFMAVAGVPTPTTNHQVSMANFAVALQDSVELFNRESGSDLSLRIGIASGKIIAGIIGNKQFIYDLWGDAVTMASFLEKSCEMGEIQVSEEMEPTLKNFFSLEESGPIEYGGKRAVITYFLKKRSQ
jgi:adenylate cyclase